jgi:hypothetical protein
MQICQATARSHPSDVTPVIARRAITGLAGSYAAQGKQAQAKQLLQLSLRPDAAVR